MADLNYRRHQVKIATVLMVPALLAGGLGAQEPTKQMAARAQEVLGWKTSVSVVSRRRDEHFVS